jgi:hypothetical protein
MAARRRGMRAFGRSVEFQIVLVPAVFALIAALIPEPWSAIPVAAGAVLLFGWYFRQYRKERRRRRAAFASLLEHDVGIPAGGFDGLVLFLSNRQDRSLSLLTLLHSAVDPTVVVMLVSEDAQREVAGAAQRLFESDEVTVHRIPVSLDDEADPRRLAELSTEAINVARSGRRSVLADITGGTKVMSIGLFQAAADSGVSASYVQFSTTGQWERVNLLLDATSVRAAPAQTMAFD